MRKLKFPLGRFPIWIVISCCLMLALGFIAQALWLPDGWQLRGRVSAANATTEISPVSQVVISEVMSSNKAAWPGADGLYPDWAEICNLGNAPVDITSWTLTDNPNRKKQFSFDSQILPPGGYVLIYLTGNLQSQPGAPYQAPFKLNASGDALLLYDEKGDIMQAMNLPALSADTSYALEGASGGYRATSIFTPGMANTRSSHASLTGPVNSPVVINELMAVNRSSLADGDGERSDWAELYNTGNEPVNLKGYGLSDDAERPLKWKLPDLTIGPGEYLIVFLSGKDRAEGELHANFKLASEGEEMCLSDDTGRLIQRLDYGVLGADQVWARDGAGNYAVRSATPGRAN